MNDVVFKVLSIDDIELVRKWRNSDAVSKYMYDEKSISESQQKKWFEKISREKTSIYWIIEYEEKKIGLVSITGINNVLSSCFWAFYLGDTSIRGAGIGSKIEFNVLEYVFNKLNLNKLRCEVFVNNDRVIKMHEKFGFRREAYYREHCIKNGQKLDVIGLAILQSEWNSISQTMKNKIYG
tara:strand:+ start:1189 stop:1731 length:543 start_codon:yes stop_codon:yes gene_type:complete